MKDDRKYRLFFCFTVLIHILLYVSAVSTGWLDVFFDHVTRGQDFFQVPNGAYAFLHGGSLVGMANDSIPRFAECCGVNNNVYHPLFTLLVGIPLQWMPPDISIAAWTVVHLLVTVGIVCVLLFSFPKHPLRFVAASVYLLNSYHYYEIQHSQYHFLFLAFVLLLIIELWKKNDSVLAGIFLFLSLLVKPIGVLFFVPLLLSGRWKTVFTAGMLFSAVTVPLLWWKPGAYYVDNLLANMKFVYPSYNIYALVRVFHIPIEPLVILRNVFMVALIFYQIIKKPTITILITLWLSFQMIFYVGVYHYYYTAGAIMTSLCILTGALKKTILSVFTILLVSLPTPIVFFRLAGDPAIIPEKHLAEVALYSIATLLLFLMTVAGDSPITGDKRYT